MSENRSDFAPKGRPLTGRTVLLCFVGAFAVIFGANMALVVAATGSFSGLIVKNSYVTSQAWNDEVAAIRALGWTSAVGYGDGRLRIEVTDADGRAVDGLELTAVVGRPAQAETDRTLSLVPRDGGYEAAIDLAPGNWRAAFTEDWTDAFKLTAKLYVAPE
ncbi:MAG: FixH family protein [Pikeienuella sp.]